MTEPVFVDTSAFLALVSAKDDSYRKARLLFASLRRDEAPLVSTSAVLIETYALLGRRFGLDAVRSFRSDLAPLLEIVWVDEPLHEAGLDLWLERGRRHLSLVDAISFLAMKRAGINDVFAFDPHFDQEGFKPLT